MTRLVLLLILARTVLSPPAPIVQTDQVPEGVRIVDLRDAADYEAGHLPGAVRMDEAGLRDADDGETYLPSPEEVAALMGAAGIGDDTVVVAYDDEGGKRAARLWYVLNAFGHPQVSVLDGGFARWKAEGRPVSTEAVTPAPATFTPRPNPAMTCPTSSVLAAKPGVVVLDARSPAEFSGEKVSPGAARAGAIPGAVNVEWTENLEGPYRTFKPLEVLREMYAARGITPDKEVVVHCSSGGRAAHTLLVLRTLGYRKVTVYYGSYSDYSRRR